MRQVYAFPLFPFKNLFPGLTLMQHELKGTQLPYLDSEKYEKNSNYHIGLHTYCDDKVSLSCNRLRL